MKETKHAATLVLALLAFGASGCSREGAAGKEDTAIRILTVDEYLQQPQLRKQVFAECANDPGRKGDDPNCVNALRAERIAAAGTGRFPSVTP